MIGARVRAFSTQMLVPLTVVMVAPSLQVSTAERAAGDSVVRRLRGLRKIRDWQAARLRLGLEIAIEPSAFKAWQGSGKAPAGRHIPRLALVDAALFLRV